MSKTIIDIEVNEDGSIPIDTMYTPLVQALLAAAAHQIEKNEGSMEEAQSLEKEVILLLGEKPRYVTYMAIGGIIEAMCRGAIDELRKDAEKSTRIIVPGQVAEQN